MPYQMLGLDIGNANIKMALCTKTDVKRLAVSDTLPDHLLENGRIVASSVLSDQLRLLRRQSHISCRNVSLLLPDSLVYLRTLTVPAMTEAQLKINLPYEFHDFIEHDMDQYIYDYAVLYRHDDENGQPVEFELMAAAVSKEVIEEYRQALRHAGLRLVRALPCEAAYSAMLQHHELVTAPENPREYALLDLGASTIRMHFYHGAALEMNKTIDIGVEDLARAISEALLIDPHLARNYISVNHQNCLNLPACKPIYQHAALEVMKALNFHAYQHRDSEIDTLYYFGGAAHITPLVQEICDTVSLTVKSADQLLPSCSFDSDNLLRCAPAISAGLV